MLRLQPLDRPEVEPLSVTTQLRSQFVYFATASGPGVPELGDDEYYFDETDVARALEEGVVELISPLDTANMTEVEITEEQENLLQWLQANQVRHVRVVVGGEAG